MKKINKILTSVVMMLSVISTTGCSSGEYQLNKERNTGYTFDIVDYLDFNVFGENGDGYLEITAKDISAQDFETDDDYIRVRKDLDTLNPYYVTNGDSSGIKVSYVQYANSDEDGDVGLSNGDIVSIQFNLDDEEKYSDINTENYEYKIENLEEELDTIDLFGEDFVTVYGDQDGALHLNKEDNSYDFTKYLNYVYQANTKELEANKTVVDLTVDLLDSFKAENQYTDINEYLAKEYSLKTNDSGSVVLSSVATPVTFGNVLTTDLYNTLFNAISKNTDSDKDPYVSTLISIQKTEREQASLPYECMVVYSTVTENVTEYWVKTVTIGMISDKLVIMELGNTSSVYSEERARGLLSDTNTIEVQF